MWKYSVLAGVVGVALAPVAGHAQALQSGSIGGMPYYLLPASGGCSAATPCSVVTYLSYMDEAQSATASDVQSYFGGAFAAANPHTIVIAPMITDSQSTSVNWGGYDGITSPQQAQMVAVVKAIEQAYGNTVNTKDSVVTGGSLGGDGTQSTLIAYGPKGTVQPGVFSAGLSFDAATYAASGNSADTQALCGVPLMAVHGTNDTNQSISYDQALSQSLASCGSFTLVPVQGAGHGTWGGSSGYAAGDGPGTPLAWLSAQLTSGGNQHAATAPTPAVTPFATAGSSSPANLPQAAPVPAAVTAMPTATASTSPDAASASTITPGSGSLTDASGNVWVISANGGIYENGQGVPGGGGTAALTIQNGVVYGLDAHGRGWLTLSSTGQYWTPSPSPPAVAASAPTLQTASQQITIQATPLGPAPTAAAVCASIPSAASMLPCGTFHTQGSQVVDQQNRPVRLACTAWWGDLPNQAQQMLAIVVAGRNCLRVSFFHSSMAADLALIDQAVALARPLGLRIIVNNHANEGQGACNSQQANGLWYDVGGASNGTDGCGTRGTVSDATWVADWGSIAQHFNGVDTVIGYDLWNEPTNYGVGSNWGSGDVNHDIRLAYQRAGTKIQSIDSTKLIIAEGSQDYSAGAPQGDLRPVAAFPVVLPVANKVVYSVHEYPASIAGSKLDSGPAYIAQMNAVWGYLITQNLAPVWVGEMGASMDDPFCITDEQAWAATITSYLNGTAQGGLMIPPGGQGVGTDWWMWSYMPSGKPNGALAADLKTPKTVQSQVYGLLTQTALAGTAGTSAAAYSQQLSNASALAFPNSSTVTIASATTTTSDPAPAASAPANAGSSSGATTVQADAAYYPPGAQDLLNKAASAIANGAAALQRQPSGGGNF